MAQSVADSSIAYTMATAVRLFRRALDVRLRSLGTTGTQWRVLAILTRHPGIHQGAAADMLEVEPITLSRMVDRLEEAQIVERRAVSHDRRARALHLTDAATPAVEAMRTEATRVIDAALAGFTAAERTEFIQYVDRFRQNLDQFDASQRQEHAA